ncbi:hypothetical protein [Brevundimonas sp.]|jgi:hypothetical protein|uniref:hypothetical protein n=1 Tax=Brevundimonas sp. TaxID=1871086 RepID=UPI00183F5D77|nr:hypothetical protein [Brevundimonas sp.]MBA4807257.1 hypothetical protein [Brevundimonas sp.]
MSCGLALTIALSMSNPAVALAAETPPAAVGAPVSVAGEPLFSDIVARSGALKTMVDGWAASKAAEDAAFFTGQAFAGFKAQAAELAALDMQGHLILKQRGTDGDLKCILRGISEDIPKKIEAVQAATTPAERATALSELSYLLNDNVEVITAPPAPEV